MTRSKCVSRKLGRYSTFRSILNSRQSSTPRHQSIFRFSQRHMANHSPARPASATGSVSVVARQACPKGRLRTASARLHVGVLQKRDAVHLKSWRSAATRAFPKCSDIVQPPIKHGWRARRRQKRGTPSGLKRKHRVANLDRFANLAVEFSSKSLRVAVPRGLRHCSPINTLQKSGTLNRSTGSLGFFRECPTKVSALAAQNPITPGGRGKRPVLTTSPADPIKGQLR